MAAFIDQENTAKTELGKVLAELVNIKPNDLVRVEDLGRELSFEVGLSVFENTLKLYNDLHHCNLDNIPLSTINNLKSQVNDALNKFKQIKDFSAKAQNPLGTRDNLITTLRNQYDTYFQIISPVIAYSIRKGTDFDKLEKQARETLENLEKIKIEFNEKIKFSENEINSTLEKVRIAAAEVGVAQHSIHFKEEAEEHKKQSKTWLIATIFAAALTICWGAASFFIHSAAETTLVIQYTVAKLIILSALYYALVWCARNFNAHRHNYIVNKHRQNSLSTFETFVKAAGDDADTKNAVLLQTTFSIFSAQPSGYIQKDAENDNPNKFIEILRSTSSQKIQ